MLCEVEDNLIEQVSRGMYGRKRQGQLGGCGIVFSSEPLMLSVVPRERVIELGFGGYFRLVLPLVGAPAEQKLSSRLP